MVAAAPLMFAGATSILDIMSGVFGHLAAREAAGIAESRSRMVRAESDAEAQRYSEQARGLRAKTKLAFLKSGVDLSGSPLDVLDADILTAQENIAAIRAGGRSRALEYEEQAGAARNKGRAALINGISSAFSRFGLAAYNSASSVDTSTYNRKNLNPTTGRTTGYGGYGHIE